METFSFKLNIYWVVFRCRGSHLRIIQTDVQSNKKANSHN